MSPLGSESVPICETRELVSKHSPSVNYKSISGGRNLGWGAWQEVGLERWGGVEWDAEYGQQAYRRATWQDFIN